MKNIKGLLFKLLVLADNIPAGPVQYHPEGSLRNHLVQVAWKVRAGKRKQLGFIFSILHDLGKFLTSVDSYPSHFGHDKEGQNFLLGGYSEKWNTEYISVLEDIRYELKSIGLLEAVATLNRHHMAAAKWLELRENSKISLVREVLQYKQSDLFVKIVFADSNIVLEHWDEVAKIASVLPSSDKDLQEQILQIKVLFK